MQESRRICILMAFAGLVACGAPAERTGLWGDPLTGSPSGDAAVDADGTPPQKGQGGAAAGAAGATGGMGGSASPANGGMGGMALGSGGTGGGGMAGATATGGSAGQPATGGTTGTGGTAAGGTAGSAGAAGTIDSARFHFEMGIQQWSDLTRSRVPTHTEVPPTRSTLRSFAGGASLEYAMTTTAAAERVVGVVASNIGALPAGATVTYQLWVPENHAFENVQAFVQTFTPGSWHQQLRQGSALQKNAWNQFTLVVPSTYTGQDPLELGFYFRVSGAWTGKVWIDAVDVR